MKIGLNQPLTFFNFVEVLTKLGYIQTLEQDDKSLLAIMWVNLLKENSDNAD